MNAYIFDLETYPNCFLFGGKFANSTESQMFEISDRINERDKILQWISYLGNTNAIMVGYNSLGFDYPIIHNLVNNPYTFDAMVAHKLGSDIIMNQRYGSSGTYIKMSDRVVPQLDLVKINHFDNPNKRTSLKALQFAMRSESVEDLPFELRDLTHEEKDKLRFYCLHDITETEKFYYKCEPLIKMRQDLLETGAVYGDVLNFSDVKIGVQYLIKKIGRAKCYNGSKPRQSIRTSIPFKSVILPKINYRTESFKEVHDWFIDKTYYVGGTAPTLETNLANVKFKFGVGGVHASVENKVYKSSDTHMIKDVDVAGMYPAVAIANGFGPEHLGQDFLTFYKQLSADRKQYPKGTTMNAVLKLANNGVYGNSNMVYSPFYDPKYMLSVTINGQLQLLQLVEVLSLIPGLEIIQVNTDGITVYMPRDMEPLFNLWAKDWENKTDLILEDVEYSRMWIRDVNNYMAETSKGKLKSKGAYWYPKNDKEYEGWWNKDFSNMVVEKVIQRVLTDSQTPEQLVRLVTDKFDFMLRYKATGSSKVFIGDTQQLKTVRYYMSLSGQPMKKIALPKGTIGEFKRKNKLTDKFYSEIKASMPAGTWDERIHTGNQKRYEMRTTSIQKGALVKQCNHVKDFDWSDVNYDWYVDEIRKLML